MSEFRDSLSPEVEEPRTDAEQQTEPLEKPDSTAPAQGITTKRHPIL